LRGCIAAVGGADTASWATCAEEHPAEHLTMADHVADPRSLPNQVQRDGTREGNWRPTV